MDMDVEQALEELMFPGEKPHKFYIPEMADDLKPKYGQKFNSSDDAYDLFNRYAFKAGFSIRRAREVKKNGVVNRKEFVCSKEGESDDRTLAIVGVNHHGQTTVFGCAFLNNETFDSFVWLLETWLIAMVKDIPNAPIVIITDQDQAMTKAITHGLPNTIHRYCIWHILKKMPEKTNDNFMQDHYDQLKRLIWDSESPEEFENIWFDFLEKGQQLEAGVQILILS